MLVYLSSSANCVLVTSKEIPYAYSHLDLHDQVLVPPSKLRGSSRRLNGSRSSIGIGWLDGRLTGALCVVDR